MAKIAKIEEGSIKMEENVEVTLEDCRAIVGGGIHVIPLAHGAAIVVRAPDELNDTATEWSIRTYTENGDWPLDLPIYGNAVMLDRAEAFALKLMSE